ncbi:hypothetical protein Cni_G23293 [Canna indica]|uniref:Uncharacterized protein n=1 Tax=Canna indica TaxID=4628 RepID=A0AAQ3KWW4_9LILI|nr:hypothetical protein Cni_G23293 [Canna indica]
MSAREFFWASKKKKGAKLLTWERMTDSRASGGLGIRDLEIMRKTMMAKRILPLLNNEESVWCKFYKAKYKTVHPWECCRRKHKSEQTKVVFSCLKNVRNGPCKKLANGSNIDVWRDPWVDTGPFSHWPTFIDPKELECYKNVGELIQEDDWHLERILRCFGSVLL